MGRSVSTPLFALAAVLAAGVSSCSPRLSLVADPSDPLREYTLEGRGREKLLLIPVEGTISDRPGRSLLGPRPSLVQEVVSRLRRAERDSRIRALVLKVDSPGGTVTASDVLYHEISSYRERTGVPVVAVLMKTATSGAYYLSLPADRIVAHPTTVTGSAGVIFLRPKVAGLTEKIGVGVEVSKSGRLKDLGSPFRDDTEEERLILQGLIDRLGGRFIDLIARHRRLEGERMDEVAAAGIFLAPEALRLGLVDEVGYLDDALALARELAGLGEDARVVVYGRSKRPDATAYGPASQESRTSGVSLVDLGLPFPPDGLEAGFHYLWLPGATAE